MGISLRNAAIIQSQGDNIVCESYGQSKETGKWAGAINLYKEDFFHTTLISSQAIFDTKEKAVECMKGVVEIAKKIDLSEPIKKIEQNIGSKTLELTKKIVKTAQEV